jgi:hypothetical protein
MSEDNREKRTAQRFQVLGHAQLRAGSVLVNCVIRDLSQSGAKLGVPSAARLPVNSELWLVQGDSRVRVVLRWREGDHVGVAFGTKRTGSGSIGAGPDKKAILDV